MKLLMLLVALAVCSVRSSPQFFSGGGYQPYQGPNMFDGAMSYANGLWSTLLNGFPRPVQLAFRQQQLQQLQPSQFQGNEALQFSRPGAQPPISNGPIVLGPISISNSNAGGWLLPNWVSNGPLSLPLGFRLLAPIQNSNNALYNWNPVANAENPLNTVVMKIAPDTPQVTASEDTTNMANVADNANLIIGNETNHAKAVQCGSNSSSNASASVPNAIDVVATPAEIGLTIVNAASSNATIPQVSSH